MNLRGLKALGPPGWVELLLDDAGPLRVLAKLERRSKRAVITCMILLGDIGSAAMRAVPVGRVEALLNSWPLPATLEHDGYEFRTEEIDGRPVVVVEGTWPFPPADHTTPLDVSGWGAEATNGEALGEELATVDSALAAFITKPAPKPARRTKRSRPQPARQPLTRPDGTDPEAFSRRVAEAYSEAVRASAKPAVLLAQEAGVPVVTVHRWIREARQRGFLPPARQGRSG